MITETNHILCDEEISKSYLFTIIRLNEKENQKEILTCVVVSFAFFSLSLYLT